MLSVIVPATDSPPSMGRCVAALRAAMRPGDELIVQTDPAGAGPAAARNLGVARARGDLLVFVDADVVVHRDALELIAARFERDPGLAAAFGSYDDVPAARGLVSRFRNLHHHHVHSSAPGPADTFWAGLGAIRRDAFEQAGGFDAARYPRPAIEDIELGARLRGASLRIELDPRIRGTHLKRWTLGSMIAADFGARGVPWVRLQLERREAASSLNLSTRHRLSALAATAIVLAAVRRRPGAALVAAGGMAALNAPFYALLARQGGPGLALAGLPLHALHQLTAVASVPAGFLAHVSAGTRGASR